MYIKVKVVTESKIEKFQKITDDSFKVSVREKAEFNLANKRVIEILRENFSSKSIKLVSGHHSPSKIFSID